MRPTHDTALEEALEQTFPASDPISMQQAVVVGGQGLPGPSPRKRRKNGKRQQLISSSKRPDSRRSRSWICPQQFSGPTLLSSVFGASMS